VKTGEILEFTETGIKINNRETDGLTSSTHCLSSFLLPSHPLSLAPSTRASPL
jgi:hypothetical protein